MQQAKAARKFLQAMGYPHIKDLKNIIAINGVKNCPITTGDINIAEKSMSDICMNPRWIRTVLGVFIVKETENNSHRRSRGIQSVDLFQSAILKLGKLESWQSNSDNN